MKILSKILITFSILWASFWFAHGIVFAQINPEIDRLSNESKEITNQINDLWRQQSNLLPGDTAWQELQDEINSLKEIQSGVEKEKLSHINKDLESINSSLSDDTISETERNNKELDKVTLLREKMKNPHVSSNESEESRREALDIVRDQLQNNQTLTEEKTAELKKAEAQLGNIATDGFIFKTSTTCSPLNGTCKIATTKNGNFTETGGLNNVNFLAQTLIGPLLVALSIFCTVLIVIGGLFMIFSGGNQEGITRGKTIIIYSIIGLVIALASYSIITLVSWLLTR